MTRVSPCSVGGDGVKPCPCGSVAVTTILPTSGVATPNSEGKSSVSVDTSVEKRVIAPPAVDITRVDRKVDV
jgi:hypothetical protein